MSQAQLPEMQLLQDQLRLQGRPTHGFSASVLADGSIRVRAASGAAFYPAQGWAARFGRHLRQGYFDPAPAALVRGC